MCIRACFFLFDVYALHALIYLYHPEISVKAISK